MKISNTNFKQGFIWMAILLFCGLFSVSTSAQSKWSLQKCIQYAKENSLTLKQAQYSIELAALTNTQSKAARLPTVNASTNGGFQFGRTIDPTTNSFNNQRISFNSYRLDGSLSIYNGGQLTNTIRQSEYDLKAAKQDATVAFNNTALSIANAYLQILMAEEQLENAQKRLFLSEQQLAQTDKLINAGTLPENDRLEVLAQMARDEQTIIASQNLIDINYLNLKESMQLDPNTEINVEKPNVDLIETANPQATTFREVYAKAVGTQPQVLRDELNLKSSEIGVDIAHANLLPNLALFGSLDTRWSSASKIVSGYEDVTSTQTVIIPGFPDPQQIEFLGESPLFVNNPYFDQLDQNFGQTVGLSLSVPIYNNGRNRINVERAKVGILSAKLQSDLTKQQLKTDVQNAIASARAAHRSYQAAQKTLDAAGAAFRNAEKQYELGAINTFQFTTARNTMDIAEIDLVVSKYDYIFRTKIIDFYLGKEIKIE